MSSPSSRRSPSPKPRPNRLAHTFEEKHETIEHPPRGCVAAAVYRRSLRPDINHRHRHGDNYQTFGPYPAPPPVSTINDNYWINIATYPPVATPAPAWVTTPHSLWAPPAGGKFVDRPTQSEHKRPGGHGRQPRLLDLPQVLLSGARLPRTSPFVQRAGRRFLAGLAQYRHQRPRRAASRQHVFDCSTHLRPIQ